MSTYQPAFSTIQPLTTSSLTFEPSSIKCSTFTSYIPSLRRARCEFPRKKSIACTATPPTQSLEQLKGTVEKLCDEAIAAIQACTENRDVENLRVQYLGKKGSITSIMKTVGKLPAEDRPKLGATVNVAKDKVATLVRQKKEEIEEEKLRKEEEEEEEDWVDVTMPGLKSRPMIGRMHPLNSTMDRAVQIFVELGYDLIDDDEYNKEVETDYYCFEALNCPEDHPARDMQDTFYLDASKKTLLRTQTSSVQIRYMEKNKPPFKIIAPGRVYRRDTVDSTHTSTFHQIEILAVDEMGKLTFGALRATVIHFLKEMLGEEIETRFRASYFPFTEPSAEVDVFYKGKWMEVLGCGMVDPAVLENVGLDPEKYSGFAAGFGVERFAMVIHEITDIREFYKNDMRFLVQGLTELE